MLRALAASRTRASGATVRGGRTESVPMDVTANVWTPTKDGSGDILSGSWANLPLDEWCEVADTAPTAKITAALTAAGFTGSMYGSDPIGGTLTANMGMAFHAATGRMWSAWGGGHQDSSVNGVWRLALERMLWSIDMLPSDPDAPGFEWNSYYRSTATNVSFSSYKDAGGPISVLSDGFSDVLPDGKPVSQHQWRGMVYDPTRNQVITHRNRQVAYDFDTGTFERYVYNTAGTPWAPADTATAVGIFAHYDEQTDCIFAANIKNADAWGFYKIDRATGVMTKIGGVPSDGIGWNGQWAVMGRKIVHLNVGTADSFSFDMDAQTFTNLGVLAGVSVPATEQQPLLYVPERAALLYFKPGTGFFWIDPATWTATAATFGGKTLPYTNLIGDKMAYYPARKCVVAVLSGAHNIHVMRVG